MGSFSIEWRSSTRKDLRKLPSREIARVIAAVEALGVEPRPHGSEKLSGAQQTHRIRGGDHRIVYEVIDGRRAVVIQRVRHRKDVYRHRGGGEKRSRPSDTRARWTDGFPAVRLMTTVEGRRLESRRSVGGLEGWGAACHGAVWTSLAGSSGTGMNSRATLPSVALMKRTRPSSPAAATNLPSGLKARE